MQLERRQDDGAANVNVQVVNAWDDVFRQLLLEAAVAPFGKR